MTKGKIVVFINHSHKPIAVLFLGSESPGAGV
jgi:hypothetical protein